MAASTPVPPQKKLKVREEATDDVKGSNHSACPTTGISLERIDKDKFGLLLPYTYPLNKSRTKSVMIGLRLEYETQSIVPAVVIMDQKVNGLVFGETAWNEFTNCFAEIQEYFNSDGRKFNDRLHKPAMYTGFSLTYTVLSFSLLKSKILCLRETEPVMAGTVPIEEQEHWKPSIMMQSCTFEILRELNHLITDYLLQLRSMVPTIHDIITGLIDFSKADLKNIGFDYEFENFTSDVIRCFTKKSLFKEVSLKH